MDLVDENSFEFDLGGLSNKMLNHFYFGGFLVDNEISSQSMTLFLEKNITFFNTLVDEFIKKIIHYKNQ